MQMRHNVNLIFNNDDPESRATKKHVSLFLPLRSMISDRDSETLDVKSVEYFHINAGLRCVNNFHSSVQCHGNGDAIVSVCTKLYSWCSFKRVCLYTFFLIYFFDDSFAFFLSRYLCHGRVTVLRREIPE